MTTAESCFERLRTALTVPTPRAILGIVDQVLAVALECDLRLVHKEDYCHIEILGGAPANSIEVPVRKSVFRAALARVSVLCNERGPRSVSPYGGEGEIVFGSESPSLLHAAFVNTPDEQSLVLTSVGHRPVQNVVSPSPEQAPIQHDVAGRT